MDEIKVKVTKSGRRKFLLMFFDDPVTGKREWRSTRKTKRREAERVAAKWEAELNEGRYIRNSHLTWELFRERYHDEKLVSLSPKTQMAFDVVANHLERLINPKMLTSITEQMLSQFQAKLRGTGIAETSIGVHLGHLRAALNWAAKQKLIREPLHFDMPKPAKGQRLMRGRAISGEEFERMLDATKKLRPNDSEAWVHYLKGLWFSGLRLEESTVVSWDDDAPFMLDVSGKYPRFRIYGAAQKAGRDEYLPTTPDFAQFILATPVSERTGRLFKLNGRYTGKQISTKRICRLIGEIGKRAGVIVERKAAKEDNAAKLKFATAHDLRRSFGSRWARRVTSATLKRLMRHDDVKTTMKYYVDLDSDDIAAELWQSYDNGVGVDTLVDTSPNQAEPHTHKLPQI